MGREGWSRDANGRWIMRFRHDWESWDQNPKVSIDNGRLQSNGIPLLKSRMKIRRRLAIELWIDLMTTGWRRIGPQWD